MKKLLFAVLVLLPGASLMAEVRDAGKGGFTVVNRVLIAASSEIAWQAAINDVGLWWNPDHTVSGDASRLSIDAQVGGCFCEYFGGGAGVRHLDVTMVNPLVLLRLTGGLGPLGLMGVSGNMTWEFEGVGDNTQLTFTYAVGGYSAAGLDALAGPVDGVLAEALDRLKAHAEALAKEPADLG